MTDEEFRLLGQKITDRTATPEEELVFLGELNAVVSEMQNMLQRSDAKDSL